MSWENEAVTKIKKGKIQWWNVSSGYGLIAIILHWAVALGVVLMLGMGFIMSGLIFSGRVLSWYPFHKTMGVLILVLMLWRSINRYSLVRVRSPNSVLHGLLYVGLLVMPVSGWVMSCSFGKPPILWGVSLWIVPGGMQWLGKLAASLHLVVAIVTSVLIAIHIFQIWVAWRRGEKIAYRMGSVRYCGAGNKVK